jgi:hypothetical protein
VESIRGGVGTDGKSSCDLGSILPHVPLLLKRYTFPWAEFFCTDVLLFIGRYDFDLERCRESLKFKRETEYVETFVHQTCRGMEKDKTYT